MSDPRVEAAIAHWAPRFIAQGIDYNDFVRTTARIQEMHILLGQMLCGALERALGLV